MWKILTLLPIPLSTSITVQNFIHNAASINHSSIFMGRLPCVSPSGSWVICTWRLVLSRSLYNRAFLSWGYAEQKNHEVSWEVFGSSASPSTCSLCFTRSVVVPCLVCFSAVLRGQRHLWAGPLGSPFHVRVHIDPFPCSSACDGASSHGFRPQREAGDFRHTLLFQRYT